MLWGIDLGGTKIEGAVLRSPDDTAPNCRIRIDTEAQRGYEHIVDRIGELVAMMRSEVQEAPSAIGFGTPGTVDPPTGLMKNCNTTCLNGRPLAADLLAKLGVPVRVANDANCFALAEARLGVARGFETVFGIIMGTGVGGGIVVRGHVLTGAQGIAGEWGHNILEPGGHDCYCGKRGCVETYLCGPAVERFYASMTGKTRSLKDVAAAHAEGGDPAATATIRYLCEEFGRAVAVVLNVFDPDAVVLGGGVGNVPELGTWGVDECRKWIFNNRLDTLFLKPTLGDSAGVFGAAMLVAEGQPDENLRLPRYRGPSLLS